VHRLAIAVVVAWLPSLATAAPAQRKPPKVAVTEIAAPTGDAALTSLLSELALTEASASGRFAVIGPSDITALIGLARTRQVLGCGDGPDCFADLHEALGADYLLVGMAGVLGPTWRLDVKLVDVKRQVVMARTGEAVEPKPELLAAAIQRCVREVLAAVTPPLLSGRQKAGWITAGVGGACLAGSAVFGLLARSAWNDLKAAEDSGDALAWDRQRDLVKRRALVADLLLGAGAVGAGVGAWLIFGGDGAPRAGVTALPGGAAVAFEGRF
jgi:hypothetical protein